MSYASDKLYSGYMRTNMPRIVSTVKPREIIIHLPCLTEHDREQIEAKNDFSGSYEAMKMLLSCMKRRESWPEQFIGALEACEHRTIAAEIRAEYDKLRGINNNSSPPPPAPAAANVVTAYVHPAPSAPHLSDEGPTASAHRVIPPEARETNPIQETEMPSKPTPAQPIAQAVEITTPPEPPQVQAEPQTETVPLPRTTPPPSPKLARESANPPPPPEPVDIIPHQEPEENLEPDIVQAPQVHNEIVNVPQEAEENTEVPSVAELKDEPCETNDSMETVAPALTIESENTPFIEITTKPILVEPEPVTVVMEDQAVSTTTVEDALTKALEYNPIVPTVPVEADAITTAFENNPIVPTVPVENAIITAFEDNPIVPTVPVEEDALTTEFEDNPEVPPLPVENAIPKTSEDNPIAFPVPAEEDALTTAFVDNPTSPPPVPLEDAVTTISEDISIVSPVPVEEATALATAFEDNSIASTVPVEVSPARSASPQTNLDDLILTPEKPPVQETSPREEKVTGVVPMMEDTAGPQNTQVVEIGHVEVGNGEANRGLLSEDADIFFSKPGVLMSVVPPDQDSTTIRPSSLDPTPYSGNSDRLEMSEEVKSAPSCLENGVNHKEPDKDVTECPDPNPEEEDVEENVVQVAEEPSMLNKEMQMSLTEDSEEPNKEESTGVLLLPETTVISCTNFGDLSEFPAPGLDAEGEKENGTHVVQQASIFNQENQKIFTEDIEDQAIDVTFPAMISDTSHCPNEEEIPESPAPSLDMEDVRENVGHVVEEPSLLNLDVQMPLLQINGEPANDATTATVISDIPSITNVQTPAMQVNGEPVKEITPLPPKLDPSSNDNQPAKDPMGDQKLVNSGNPTTSRRNARYILTAAGVGACALLIAWRFKH